MHINASLLYKRFALLIRRLIISLYSKTQTNRLTAPVRKKDYYLTIQNSLIYRFWECFQNYSIFFCFIENYSIYNATFGT